MPMSIVQIHYYVFITAILVVEEACIFVTIQLFQLHFLLLLSDYLALDLNQSFFDLLKIHL